MNNNQLSNTNLYKILKFIGYGNLAIYFCFYLYYDALEFLNIIHYICGGFVLIILLFDKILAKDRDTEDLTKFYFVLLLCIFSVLNNINFLISEDYQGDYKVIRSWKQASNRERLEIQLDNGKKFDIIVAYGRRDLNFRKGVFGIYFAK